MWAMAQSSMVLFFRGKLFADPGKVLMQLAIGVVVTAIVMIALAKLGAPVWLAALVAGLVGGALQPYLFKDLRYR
jgi:Kef-type K+ transport system membrane component KefB